MKQALGDRKCRRIERLTGRRVMAAFTRGGWEHFWAETLFHDGTIGDVNYKTGAVEMAPQPSMMYPLPWWGSQTPHFLGEGI